jgi:hypothetical protein
MSASSPKMSPGVINYKIAADRADESLEYDGSLILEHEGRDPAARNTCVPDGTV